jgi:lipid II:glycine glycyltransferase (peptidoglycan interpeptide bridge formation enzyme)
MEDVAMSVDEMDAACVRIMDRLNDLGLSCEGLPDGYDDQAWTRWNRNLRLHDQDLYVLKLLTRVTQTGIKSHFCLI